MLTSEGGSAGCWVQLAMAGEKAAQGRKAPGAVPTGVFKQATTEVGVQWMVK